MDKYIGIDVGGTGIKLGLFSGETLADKWEIPTDLSDNGTHILRDIARVLPGNAVGAGLAVPGAVLPDGTVNRCVNLGWDVCRPGDEFSRLTGLPCRVCNDANAAAAGEQWQGGGKNCDSVLLVTIGTGVGAGVVWKGQLIPGAHGAAGEIGHICVNPTETAFCSCGNRGCLEQYCSGTAIARQGQLAGLAVTGAKDVFEQAIAGNVPAMAVIDNACTLLGQGIATACTVLDPDAVVLGGGVSRSGEFFRTRVEAAFGRYCFHACQHTQIRLALLGAEAGIYGAARLAMKTTP